MKEKSIKIIIVSVLLLLGCDKSTDPAFDIHADIIGNWRQTKNYEVAHNIITQNDTILVDTIMVTSDTTYNDSARFARITFDSIFTYEKDGNYIYNTLDSYVFSGSTIIIFNKNMDTSAVYEFEKNGDDIVEKYHEIVTIPMEGSLKLTTEYERRYYYEPYEGEVPPAEWWRIY